MTSKLSVGILLSSASFKEHRLTSLKFKRNFNFLFDCTETVVEFSKLLLFLVNSIFT